jgi:hypothetical protein
VDHVEETVRKGKTPCGECGMQLNRHTPTMAYEHGAVAERAACARLSIEADKATHPTTLAERIRAQPAAMPEVVPEEAEVRLQQGPHPAAPEAAAEGASMTVYVVTFELRGGLFYNYNPFLQRSEEFWGLVQLLAVLLADCYAGARDAA